MSKYGKVTHLYELEKYCKDKGLDIDILIGKKCQYCNKKTNLVGDKEIYNVSYSDSKNYQCKDCSAHVGCHKGTEIGLGVISKIELRSAKYKAHRYFDNVWKKVGFIKNMSKSQARKAAYKWLAKEMNKPLVLTHIGMMTVEECNEVIKLCKPFYDSKYDD